MMGGAGGGGGLQRKEAGEKWPNLVDVILSWKLHDVMNEGLFKGKVGTPPSIPSLCSSLGIGRFLLIVI